MKNRKKSFSAELESFVDDHYYLLMLIILALLSLALFYKLGSTPVQDWDEARHGITAYEMLINKNFLISTYNFETDYYNLKPPLGMWLIALAYKLFGVSVFSLRFFSAVSVIMTVLVTAKILKDNVSRLSALMGAAILGTNFLFINWHTGRTGDFDAQLALLFTLCMYCVIKLEKDIRYFYLGGFVFSLAFLLKSYATIQIVAVVGVILLATGKLFRIKLKEYLIFLCCCLLPVLLWMLFRYSFDGLEFLKKMITYDVLQRSTSTIEGHYGSVFYYAIYILRNVYIWVLYALIIIALYLAANRWKIDISRNRFIKLSLIIWAALPFILFSAAKSKLVWYINSIYPALSILIAWITYRVLSHKGVSEKVKIILISVFVIGILYGEGQIIKSVNEQKAPAAQLILRKLGTENMYRGTVIYKEEWKQSEMFVGEVISGLTPRSTSKEDFLSRNMTGLFMLPKDSTSMEFVTRHNLKVILDEQGYVIINK